MTSPAIEKLSKEVGDLEGRVQELRETLHVPNEAVQESIRPLRVLMDVTLAITIVLALSIAFMLMVVV